MCISDWSSDVCSSDLPVAVRRAAAPRGAQSLPVRHCATKAAFCVAKIFCDAKNIVDKLRTEERRVGKEMSVRVDFVGRRFITKKNNTTNTHKSKQVTQSSMARNQKTSQETRQH